MTRSATLSFALFALASLYAAPAAAQGAAARPGAGYVARALTGGVPVGVVRGRYPGTTTDVLFVVSHPTPDSTTFSAFVGGQLDRRLTLPMALGTARFLDADIPVPGVGEPAPTRSFVAFTFDNPDTAFNVLWDYGADRWALAARYKASGSLAVAGDSEWFGDALMELQNPTGGPEGELPARVWKQNSRRLAASGTTSLQVERKSYREVPDVYYTVGVYNGDVGPVQTMNGITRTTPSSIDDASSGACSGLPAVRDVNGDGHADFWLCDSESADGYQTGTYRLYDPEAGLFVKDLAFSFRGSHTFDAATRTVHESRSSGAGAYQTQSEYSLASGVPVLIRQQKREPESPSCAGGPTCRARFTTRVREGGTMRETENRLGRAGEALPAGFGYDPATSRSMDSTEGGRELSRPPEVLIVQAGRSYPLLPRSQEPGLTTLAPGPFTIEFPGVPADGTVMVCAQKGWVPDRPLEVGMPIVDYPCLGLGTGMALEPVHSQFDFPLVVNSGGGHMHVSPDRRRPSEGLAVVEVAYVEYADGTDYGAFYMTVVSDMDGDGVLDEGEGWTAYVNVE